LSSDETTTGSGPAAVSVVESQVKVVLERAIEDAPFRRLLLDDPDTALAGYRLSEVQALLLRSLDDSDLDKLTPENLDEYFAVDSAVYTPDDVGDVELSYAQHDADEIRE